MAMVTICSDLGAQENKVHHCFHCFQVTFHVIHSVCRLNKQGDDIQPWCTAFPTCKQSIVPSLVLTVASWPTYKFCRRQVRWLWYSHLIKNFPQFIVIHTVKGLGIVNKAEIHFFSGTLLLFRWSSGCWQFDLWYLCLFENQLEHQEVHGSCIAKVWLGEFWALLY